jgi:hypothetical protein
VINYSFPKTRWISGASVWCDLADDPEPHAILEVLLPSLDTKRVGLETDIGNAASKHAGMVQRRREP